MIQLLYTVILGQMGVIMTLLFKTPLRKLVIMGLDRAKRGSGPLMVKTVAGTVFVVLLSSVFSMVKIQHRSIDAGVLSPTDQVLMSRHMLEATLMGFSLFLSLMIDRLHHYIRELRLLRKTMEATKKHNRGFEDGKNGSGEQLKAVGEEITTLREKIKKLESDCEMKADEAKAAKAEAEALRKQSEGFLLEYDRLLEDNQNLKNQLESIDQSFSQSDGNKNM
ncbi:Bap31 domain-containing protein [Cephalotus follicularis]|uniref:Endoplasmic reticulum transmembrane protein n=1 Tax=Cephalotus follicularis TaxID=3775 RepID=A0A1Q3C0Z0_CEPFO|nr:Bap31 domain-containing protein [Cephalotus follicularis]